MKKIKLIKRILTFSLTVLLSLDSFAAVVSDNDGAAFITKAEFDSLRIDFQSALDRYNSNIDTKIEAAIASYIEGVKRTKVEDLDSLLNKINDACGDSYKNSSGDTVKYNYRVMARKFNMTETRKPVGAITNLFMIKVDNDLNGFWESNFDSNTSIGWGMFRLGMNFDTRTGFGDVTVPDDGSYQTGKYFMISKNKYGIYPANQMSEVTYRYYVSGSSFTYGVKNLPAVSDSWAGFGTANIDEMKNQNTYWSFNYANAEYHWTDEQEDAWNTWRNVYGTTYQKTDADSLFPICGIAQDDCIALKTENVPKMTLQDNAYVWTTFTQYGTAMRKKGDMDKMVNQWVNNSTGGTIPVDVTLNFNCHPYESINTEDLLDSTSSIIYGKAVKITDGLPICKVTANGVLDMKLTLWRANGTGNVAFGLSNEPLTNETASYRIKSDLKLRDFDDNRITTNTFSQGEHEFRVDVKKGDTLWIKTVAVGDDYGFSGAKTTELKLKAER